MAEKYAVCSYCGEQIKSIARACPHCGSDESTGWSEMSYMDGIDYVDENQYEEIREQEFSKKTPLFSWQIITGIAMLVIFVLMFLFKFFK